MPCFEVGIKAKEIIEKLSTFFKKKKEKEVKGNGEQTHDCTDREQNLKEWCSKLPEFHRVNKELQQLQETIDLLDEAITVGLSHIPQSVRAVEEASVIFKGKV